MKMVWMNIALTMVSCYHAQYCQVGQEKYGSSCYQLLDEKMNWDKANTTCSDMGGGMAVPDTEEERKFIWEMLTRKFHDQGVWIGCTDREKEGKWVQAGGEGQECSYLNWAKGEPGYGGLGNGEDCIELWIRRSGLMNDKSCSYDNHVICEFPIPKMLCLRADANGRFTLK